MKQYNMETHLIATYTLEIPTPLIAHTLSYTLRCYTSGLSHYYVTVLSYRITRYLQYNTTLNMFEFLVL